MRYIGYANHIDIRQKWPLIVSDHGDGNPECVDIMVIDIGNILRTVSLSAICLACTVQCQKNIMSGVHSIYFATEFSFLSYVTQLTHSCSLYFL